MSSAELTAFDQWRPEVWIYNIPGCSNFTKFFITKDLALEIKTGFAKSDVRASGVLELQVWALIQASGHIPHMATTCKHTLKLNLCNVTVFTYMNTITEVCSYSLKTKLSHLSFSDRHPHLLKSIIKSLPFATSIPRRGSPALKSN